MTYFRLLLTLSLFTLPVVACSSGNRIQSSSAGLGVGSTSASGGGAGGEASETGGASGAGGTGETSGAGGGSSSSGTGGGGQCQGNGATGYNPYKYAFYGDLHQHTSYSLDAYAFGTRSDPHNAYLYAKGQAAVNVGEGSDAPVGPTLLQQRPLDFLAITDHSEWLSIVRGCTIDQHSGYYHASDCGLVRSHTVADESNTFHHLRPFQTTLCQKEHGADCAAEEKTAWSEMIGAANEANSPCQFTALVAYEWSATEPVIDRLTGTATHITNHRNVIFANDDVPAAPLDSVDYPSPPELWTGLDSQCTAASGCDAITIPHNTNLSGGLSLVVWDPTPAGVAQQQRYQVSAEVYQHKSASECYYDPSSGYHDPDCKFEYPGPDAINLGAGSFVREGLGTGLGYAAAHTAQGNPLKLGIVGGTDDHNGAPGEVDDARFAGHAGMYDDTALARLTGAAYNGPGGLTGAWAEQNTRESIFAAVKRRETFATSGPRISVRFYQTSDATACADPAFPKKILDAGTALPMGSTFGAAALAGAAAPTFAIAVWPDAVPQALADGTNDVAGLAKVQIIKVRAYVANGQQVIVGDPPQEVSDIPAMGGCAMWTDASFDPAEYAVYYVRALQVPTWRWSHWSCQQVKDSNPSTWQALVPGCAPGGGLDVSIQERAWTSPVWYEPG